MTSTYAQRRALGDFGERVAARFLTQQGLVVLDRNWRCRQGELDIVATDGEVLVACEVKTRSSTRYGSPLDAIDAPKAARLHGLVRAWAAAHEHRYSAVRIDVVAILQPRRGKAQIEHLVGVS